MRVLKEDCVRESRLPSSSNCARVEKWCKGTEVLLGPVEASSSWMYSVGVVGARVFSSEDTEREEAGAMFARAAKGIGGKEG